MFYENTKPHSSFYSINQNASLSCLLEKLTQRIDQVEVIAITGGRCKIDELAIDIIDNYFSGLRNAIEDIKLLHSTICEKLSADAQKSEASYG